MSYLLIQFLAIVATFTLVRTTVLHDSTGFQFEIYKRRNHVLLELLIKEECLSLPKHDRETRAVSPPETELEAERVVYKQLTDELIACRAAKSERSRPTVKQTVPTSTKSPTPTTMSSTPMPTPSTRSTTTPTPLLLACRIATNLTQYWRKDHAGSNINPSSPICDNRDMVAQGRPWFRFSGAAGNRLLDHCIDSKHAQGSCGTHRAIWSDAPVPHQVGVVTTIQVFGSYNGCKAWTQPCSVVRCSNKPHDFVYRYDGDAGDCHNGFCGMD